MEATWQITITLPVIAVEVFLEAFDTEDNAVSCFEDDENKCWKLAFHTPQQPNPEQIAHKINRLSDTLEIPVPPYAIERVEPANWVAESQKNFLSTTAGDFFIYATWHNEQKPEGKHFIQIDPEQAFGTGGHETTSGCLIALSRLAADGNKFKNMLDLGCGSGILAIAMARLWKEGRILAVDIDPVSVSTSINNAALNQVPHIQVEQSNGYECPSVQSSAPYDLIAANILAKPLIRFAPTIRQSMVPGGYLILSGLLDTQEQEVAETYIQQGLHVVDTVPIGQWRTLVMEL